MKRYIFKTRRLISMLVTIGVLISVIAICRISTTVNASEVGYLISGDYYYIKNVNSGKYLTVDVDNVNVCQRSFEGTSRQRWKLLYTQSGTYEGYYRFKSSYDTTKFLTVVNGSSDDGTNIRIETLSNSSKHYYELFGWDYNSNRVTAATQTVIYPSTSNRQLSVSVENGSCVNGTNVCQNTYSNIAKNRWIFEPTGDYKQFVGANYAKIHYNNRMVTYPNLNGYNNSYAYESTNFVSQCINAGGYHYDTGNDSEWYINKWNSTYLAPTNSLDLSYSWDLANNSPWMNPEEFSFYWSGKNIPQINYLVLQINTDTCYDIPGQSIPLSIGDVVQITTYFENIGYVVLSTMYIADNVSGDALNHKKGDILVTGHKIKNGNDSYIDIKSKTLREVCSNYLPTYSVVFYHFSNL